MNIFKNIFKANAEVARLEVSNTDWATRYQALEAQVEGYKTSIETFATEKATFLKQIEDMKAEQTVKITEVTKESDTVVENLVETIKEVAESAEAKAVDIVASLGVEANTVSVTSSEVNPTEIYSKFIELAKTDSKGANDYYKANRETLIKQSGYKQSK